MTRRKKVRHYRAEQWVDFARGLASGADHRHMQAHLNTGCANCWELAAFYAKVAARASADVGCELPAASVKQARAIYVRQQLQFTGALERRVRKAA
jgi:hypothetical protein